MAEVYAGFSEYTDAQVGRIIDYLEESGQLENTLVIYCADNGASGEGSPNGSVNVTTFANGYPDDIAENLARIDELGTLQLPGRCWRPAGHLLAEGNSGTRRSAHPVPPRDGSSPSRWLQPDSATGCVDALFVRGGNGADAHGDPVLRDAGHARHLAQGLERGGRPGAGEAQGVSFKVLAEVDLTDGARGVIFAHGSRFGGHALFLKHHKLHYVYNFLLLVPEQHLVADLPVGHHVVGLEFIRTRMGQYHESYAPAKLYVDDRAVAEQEMRTMSGHFAITREGPCIGYDSGDAVSSEYQPKFELACGRIDRVVFHVADDVSIDVERHFAAAMARD